MKRSKKKGNLIIEKSPVILLQWRGEENWSVEYVSQNITRFGYTPDELVSGKVSFSSLVYPDDLNTVVEERQRQSLESADMIRQKYRVLNRDGRVCWVDDQTIINRDEEGCITYYQTILIDISKKKKRMEKNLQDREDQYRRLIDSSFDGILIHQDGLIVYVNETAIRYIGASSLTEVI